MNEPAHDSYLDSVWSQVAAAGVEGSPVVRQAYRTMLEALAEAGASVELSARFLERQVRVALDQYGALLEALELVSDSLALTVDISNGENDDPVSLGYSLVKQKAGLSVLHDNIARLAPFAGVGEGWDVEETARARAAALAERDGFLEEIQAAAARS